MSSSRTDALYHVQQATDIFATFKDTPPETIDIGIAPIMKHIGGMFPGNTIIIGSGQNVGKTSMVQQMLHTSKDKGGVCSGEDGSDVWGAREVAWRTGISPERLRRKDLTGAEVALVREAMGHMEEERRAGTLPEIADCIGFSQERIMDTVAKLADRGCRWLVLDYLQKFRGGHSERRIEVASVLTNFHKACYEHGMVPICMSQIVRLRDSAEPYNHNLKESGDLENEARLIMLMWRDQSDSSIVRCKVSKSTFGGGGLRFAYRYDNAGRLEEWNGEDEDDFEWREEG